MQVLSFAILLFAASVSAEQPQEVQPVVSQPQQAQVVPVHSVVEQPHVHHVHQPVSVGEHQHQHSHSHEHSHEHAHPHEHAHQHEHHYAPAGVIQMVSGGGPQHYSSEQYGKPESSAIPANYKPFGSWGLYIGGNPADGYYTNYYKALGNTVDKQQVSAVEPASQVKPVSGASGINQASAFGPILKQASSYPYGSYADQVYPFDYYTPADLNSGSRVSVAEQSGPSVYAAGPVSPVQVGSQVFGAPVASYGSEQPVLAYADHYSTKRVGSQFSSSKGAERVQPQQQQQQQVVEQVPAKGYQSRVSYAHQPVYHAYQQHYSAQQPQVVAYPVPVGSQIVGSQPGADGAYAPYGVHGYTRYAIKPTVVASSEQYYHQGVHSAPVSNFPVYKQQQQQQHVAYQPLSFYGYPLNQLHYSQSSVVPAFGHQQAAPVSSQVSSSGHQHPVVSVAGEPQQVGGALSPPAPFVEAASSEKSEALSENKPKEQKRA